MSPSSTPPSRRKSLITVIIVAIFGVGGLFWIVAANLLTTDLTGRFGIGQTKLDCKQQGDKDKKELKKDDSIDIQIVTSLEDSFDVCSVQRKGGTTKDNLVLTVKSKVNNEATKQIRASIENFQGETFEKRILVKINDSDDCMAWRKDQEYKLKINYQRRENILIRFFEISCES